MPIERNLTNLLKCFIDNNTKMLTFSSMCMDANKISLIITVILTLVNKL